MNSVQAHLILLLHELAHGPEVGAGYGQFSEPGAGLLQVLANLSAREASVPVAAGRPPVAAFVAHLTQLLTFAAGEADGNVTFPDLSAPWAVTGVTDAQWRAEREALAAAFAQVRAVLTRRELDSDGVNGALSALVHAATHAGALRFHAANVGAR